MNLSSNEGAYLERDPAEPAARTKARLEGRGPLVQASESVPVERRNRVQPEPVAEEPEPIVIETIVPVAEVIEETPAPAREGGEWEPDLRQPGARAQAKADGSFLSQLAPPETRAERGAAFVPEAAPPVNRTEQTPQPYHQRVRLGDLERLGFAHPARGSERRPSIDTSSQEDA
jgi:hypothetical protein